MRALTLIQPCASAILLAGKGIENRPWTPSKPLVGQRIAIHAGAKFDKRDAWGLLGKLPQFDLATAPCGVIMGTALLVGWVRQSTASPTAFALESHGLTAEEVAGALKSTWRAPDSPCLWVLRAPRLLSDFIPCKGALGLWRVPEQHLAALEAINV